MFKIEFLMIFKQVNVNYKHSSAVRPPTRIENVIIIYFNFILTDGVFFSFDLFRFKRMR